MFSCTWMLISPSAYMLTVAGLSRIPRYCAISVVCTNKRSVSIAQAQQASSDAGAPALCCRCQRTDACCPCRRMGLEQHARLDSAHSCSSSTCKLTCVVVKCAGFDEFLQPASEIYQKHSVQLCSRLIWYRISPPLPAVPWHPLSHRQAQYRQLPLKLQMLGSTGKP